VYVTLMLGCVTFVPFLTQSGTHICNIVTTLHYFTVSAGASFSTASVAVGGGLSLASSVVFSVGGCDITCNSK